MKKDTPMASTLADLIAAVSAAGTQMATDQGTVLTCQTVLANAQAVVADADTAALTAADGALSVALQKAGKPGFVINADGSASIYAYTADPPGFTIIQAFPAATLSG